MGQTDIFIFTNVRHVLYLFHRLFVCFLENIPQYNSCQEIKYEIYFNTMGVFIYGGKQLLSAYEIPYDV